MSDLDLYTVLFMLWEEEAGGTHLYKVYMV